MWASTHLVGCALSQCGRNIYMFTCHYYPQGYISGVRPYLVGKPCSLCAEELGGFCLNDLCVPKDLCKKKNWTCECRLKCYNCAKLNSSSCSCSCLDGWDYLDCSRKCEDSHSLCGKKPGFWERFHCSIDDNVVAKDYCRSMCETCRNIKPSEYKNTCCDGKECPTGYVLDLSTRPCSCKLLCPGPECYKDTSSAYRPITCLQYSYWFVIIISISYVLIQ
ncbi:cysteine-rich venom protein-like [Centruroides sculpturatus]|uniref:cysteine-rich venom protein-like n=1 Tax=Centruroides sculpturatus TaxID=218467 RepID=UPI000C6E110D|nr:cysteine-rich venom protein-like [Centruroides sculpturatus]